LGSADFNDKISAAEFTNAYCNYDVEMTFELIFTLTLALIRGWQLELMLQ